MEPDNSGILTLEEISKKYPQYIIRESDFTVIKTIGQGGFAEVFLAKSQNGNLFALKRLFSKTLEGSDLKNFCREVQILSLCDNPFLLPITGFTNTYPFVIVTPFIPNDSLFRHINPGQGRKCDLNPTQKTLIAMGIAHGMARLHELGVIHRDLKSLNILLDSKFLPKICDFGIARFQLSTNSLRTQMIGTPHWMAPEVFISDNYTQKVDVYSYAIILYEMLTESIPFSNMNAMQVAMAVCHQNRRPELPPDVPDGLSKLINQCWDQNPELRPSFSDIYKAFESKKVFYYGTELKYISRLSKSLSTSNIPGLNSTYSSSSLPTPSSENIPPNISQPEIPQFNIPQPEIRQQNIPQQNILQPEIPQSNIPQPEIRQQNIPQQNILQPEIPQSNIPQQNILQPEIPQSNIPQQNILQPEIRQQNIPQQNILQPEIRQQNIPQSMDDLSKICLECTVEQSAALFPQLFSRLSNSSPDTVVQLYDDLLSLLDRGSPFIHQFISTPNSLSILNFTQPLFTDRCIKLLLRILKHPSSLSRTDFLKLFQRLFSGLFAEHYRLTIQACALFLCDYSGTADESALLSFIIRSEPTAVQRGASLRPLLELFLFLCKRHPEILQRQEHAAPFFEIVTSILSTPYSPSAVDSIDAAYMFALCFPDYPWTISSTSLESHLMSSELSSDVILFMCRTGAFRPSPNIIAGLAAISARESAAVLVLCRIATNPDGATLILQNGLSFINNGTPELFWRLLLVLFCHSHLRGALATEDVMRFLIGRIKANDKSAMKCIGRMLRRFPNTQEVAKIIVESGVFSAYDLACLNSSDECLISNALSLISHYATLIPPPDLQGIVGYLVMLLGRPDGNLTLYALNTLYALLKFQGVTQQLAGMNAEEVVKKHSLGKYGAYAVNIIQAIKNLGNAMNPYE